MGGYVTNTENRYHHRARQATSLFSRIAIQAMSSIPTCALPTAETPLCEICSQRGLRRVSGGKFWCLACGHLQS